MATDAKTSRPDVYQGFKFQVVIPGKSPFAGFSKCQNLSSEYELIKYREGHEIRELKFPGFITFPDVILERGLSADGFLQEWHESISEIAKKGNLGPDPFGDPEEGTDFRHDIFINLYKRGESSPVFRWKLIKAWPRKLDDGEMDASSSNIMIEKCEFSYERLERERNPKNA